MTPAGADRRFEAFARRANARIFYGWVMLGVGALGYFASGPGQSHVLGVFTTAIGDSLEISRTTVSSAYASATLLAAFGLPYVGRMVDHFGMRRVSIVIAGLFGLATIAFGHVQGVITLALGFMVLRLLGQGSLILCSANLVAQWFDKKRGFALSLMSLGFFLSVAVHPPLAQALISTLGWREACLWLGLASWLLLLPPFVILIQNRPEDLGLKPDGPDPDPAVSLGPRAIGAAEVGLTAKEATRTPAFWIIAASLATLSMLGTALFFHQVSILASQGLPPAMATSVFPVVALTAAISVPMVGRLLDRLPARLVFAGGLLMMSLSLAAASLVTSLASAVLYGVVFGIATAANMTCAVFLWPHYFGRRHLGAIQGMGQTIGVIGASIGPIPFGAAFDLFGNYNGALWLFALQPALCAMLVLSMTPPQLEAPSSS